jgi:uncharacterized membrane protein
MLEKFNLTAFGAFHTAIALMAVAAGILALIRHGEIGSRSSSGLAYVLLTAVTCVTGLFIFRHGGFGPPHTLAIVTLLALAAACAAERYGSPAGFARYAAVLTYSLTLFFHLIPGLNETGTRFPLTHPAFTGPEDAGLQMWIGLGFVVYLIGAAVQVLRIRRSRRSQPASVLA